jgi:hypothetical protein
MSTVCIDLKQIFVSFKIHSKYVGLLTPYCANKLDYISIIINMLKYNQIVFIENQLK